MKKKKKMSTQPVSNSGGPLQRYQNTTLASWHTCGRTCSILPWFVRGVNTRKVLLILTGYSSSCDRYVAFDTKRRILNFQPFCIKGVLYGIEPSTRNGTTWPTREEAAPSVPKTSVIDWKREARVNILDFDNLMTKNSLDVT